MAKTRPLRLRLTLQTPKKYLRRIRTERMIKPTETENCQRYGNK